MPRKHMRDRRRYICMWLLLPTLALGLMTSPAQGEECPPCYKLNPNHDPNNPYESDPKCLPISGPIEGESCKECREGEVTKKENGTNCDDGFVCCEGSCIGLPQEPCPECWVESHCEVIIAGGAPCEPAPEGSKCKPDKCVPGPAISGAELKLSPDGYICKTANVDVKTGTPTDEDYLVKYACQNGSCKQVSRETIPGTVNVKVTSQEGRQGLQAYRTYKAEFTSECDDTTVKKRKTIFIYDCQPDYYACQDWCGTQNPADPMCEPFCAATYKLCRQKCGD